MIIEFFSMNFSLIVVSVIIGMIVLCKVCLNIICDLESFLVCVVWM